MDVKPNSINIIPEEVTFTWGFRDPEEEIIEEARSRVLKEAEWAAEREGIEWEFEDRMRVSPVHFADRTVDAVQTAADDLGYDSMRIFSGAGHDASYMHGICDTAMVFAVSENGKSHNEDEYTSWDDCYTAAQTIANAALTIAGSD
nr:M20/M25/M40 family metallo-hydrolase [Salinigranum rubrum]